MTTRRSFFKSLAMLGAAAAGCPGIFIPKFEPVRWKVNPNWQTTEFEAFLIDQQPKFDEAILNAWDGPNAFYGKWEFRIGSPVETVYAIAPMKKELIEVVFHKRVDSELLKA